MVLERDRKLVEAQVKDLHARLDEAENNALKVKISALINTIVNLWFMNHLHLCILLVFKYLHVNLNSLFDFYGFKALRPYKEQFSLFRLSAQQRQLHVQASISCVSDIGQHRVVDYQM